MKTNDIGNPSRWVPITNLRQLAAIGKCMEELGECISALARAQIQGIHEFDPDDGVQNIERITEEIADVRAMTFLVSNELGLNREAIKIRAERKLKMKLLWLDMLNE